jgi:iron complex transport system substrate-binding protein
VRRFEQARVRVFVLADFTSFEGVAANIATVGALLGEDERAAELQRRFRDELAALEKRARPLAPKPPRVLHAYDDGTVSGSGTLLDAIVRAAGGVNAAAAAGLTGWKKASIETLLAMDPDIVVVGGGDPKEAAAIPGFDKLRAIKTGAIIAVPDNELGAVSHHVLKAVRKVQDGLLTRAGGGAKP